jgi:cell division protein FtsI (penicillin-binding protein 3)
LITVAYGHGIAVAPMQFAAAAAAILNGGEMVMPTLIRQADGAVPAGKKAVSAETSRLMATLFRQNVVNEDGTGKRADVEGYRVGGKTGTADRADGAGYDKHAVISSFLAAFPMDQPRYLTFVLLFEPKGLSETGGQRTASSNAAPVTGRLIARIAPLLGVLPGKVAATQ